VPGDLLRMIEEASNDDPVQLQSGFNAYDECSNTSKIKNASPIMKTIIILMLRI
jgi:hypothetical protein